MHQGWLTVWLIRQEPPTSDTLNKRRQSHKPVLQQFTSLLSLDIAWGFGTESILLVKCFYEHYRIYSRDQLTRYWLNYEKTMIVMLFLLTFVTTYPRNHCFCWTSKMEFLYLSVGDVVAVLSRVSLKSLELEWPHHWNGVIVIVFLS